MIKTLEWNGYIKEPKWENRGYKLGGEPLSDLAEEMLYKLASVLGFTFEKPTLSENELNEKLKFINQELNKNYLTMDEVIEYRRKARADKNWDIAVAKSMMK